MQKQFQTSYKIDKTSENAKKNSTEIGLYIKDHLQIKINNKVAGLSYLNFKKDNNTTLAYFRLNNITVIDKIDVTDTLLYEVYSNEIGLIYATVNGNRKNRRITNPESQASFDF